MILSITGVVITSFYAVDYGSLKFRRKSICVNLLKQIIHQSISFDFSTMKIFFPRLDLFFAQTPDFNSHGVGLAVAWLYGFEIDFVRYHISGSPACFLFTESSLNSFWHPILISKFHEKPFLTPKNHFLRPTSLWQFLIPQERVWLKRDSTFPKLNLMILCIVKKN